MVGYYSTYSKGNIELKINVSNYEFDKICLFKVDGGQLRYLLSSVTEGDDSIQFEIKDAESDFYYLGSQENERSVFAHIYLNEKSKVNLKISGNEIDKASVPNQEIFALEKKWSILFAEFNQKLNGALRANGNAFYDVISRYSAKVKAFQEQIQTSDEKFNSLMRIKVQADFNAVLLRRFSMLQQETVETVRNHPVFMNLVNKTYETPDLLKVSNGMQFIGSFPFLNREY